MKELTKQMIKILKRILVISMMLFAFAVITETGLDASRLHQEDGIYPNHSVEYVRTLNRNASTDVDAAFYNPAGLAFLSEKGLYVMVSSQTYYAKRAHTMDYYAIKYDTKDYMQTFHSRDTFKGGLPDEYSAELVAPSLPDINIVYKEKKWAAFFDFSIMQAATNMTFDQGLAIMDWGNLATKETELADTETDIFNSVQRDAQAVRNELYLGFTVGGTYRLFKWLSTSLGVRYINAKGNMLITMKDISYTVNSTQTYMSDDQEWNIDTDTAGHGFGFIIGTHFKPGRVLKPLQGLDIGLRYEFYAPMALTKTTNHFQVPSTLEMSGSLDVFKDGTAGPGEITYTTGNGVSDLKVTYPQQISLGASYYVLKDLKAEASGEITLRNLRDLDGREDDYNLGYRVGGCLEYAIIPEIKMSAGYLYNDFGIKPEKRDEADSLLTSHSVSFGFGFKVNGRLNVSIGAFYMFYQSETVRTTEYTDVTYPTYHALEKSFDETRFSVGFGLTYRFLGTESGSKSSDGEMSIKMKLSNSAGSSDTKEKNEKEV
ncbi:MAG: hypothetical protein GY754_38110 [bacterium]|nr:hypothetical protein [bacterium]